MAIEDLQTKQDLENFVRQRFNIPPTLLSQLSAAQFESGDLVASAASTKGGGWLLCDGSAVSRGTYSALFAKIGTTYGAGDGVTTFNVPDFRGRPPYGVGTHADVNALGKTDGLAVGSRTPKHVTGQNNGAIKTTTAAGGVTDGSAATSDQQLAAWDHQHPGGVPYGTANWFVKT
jgi:microcystin-dependent protein